MKNYLARLPVAEFPHTPKNGGKVVEVQHTDSVKHAMEVLSRHNIYSAPVYDADQGHHVGMIDMIDIADFITDNFDDSVAFGNGFEAIFEQAEALSKATVSDIADLSKRNSFVPVSINASMLDIVKLLTENRVHRVCVFDDKDKLVNVITQSAVLNLLQNHKFSGVETKTIKELKLGTSPVFSVDITQPTIDAFRLLRRTNNYAVPVVNKTLKNAIVSNISSKDARGTCSTPAKLHLLYAPISQFLASQTEDSVDIVAPSITVKPTDTVKTVINKLVKNCIHRVYVLDANNAPQAVITLTDVLKALINC